MQRNEILILGSIFLFATGNCSAITPGLYLSGQVGYADTHMKDKTTIPIRGTTTTTNLENSGISGRFAAGYLFNPYWAIELGYLQLKEKTLKGGSASNPFSISLQQYVIDFAGKALIYLPSHLNLYGKLGLAHLVSKLDASVGNQSREFNSLFGIRRYKLFPEFGIGLNYIIHKNFPIELAWTHIQTVGYQTPGNIDFIALGASYYFG